MSEGTAGAVLLVIGVVALFAAIVGGGIKIQQIEVGSLPSKWRQWLLAAFGLVVGMIGLMMIVDNGGTPEKAAEGENVATTEANAGDENVADENAVDPNLVDESINKDSNEVAPEENSELQ